jgi:hypothetical protein
MGGAGIQIGRVKPHDHTQNYGILLIVIGTLSGNRPRCTFSCGGKRTIFLGRCLDGQLVCDADQGQNSGRKQRATRNQTRLQCRTIRGSSRATLYLRPYCDGFLGKTIPALIISPRTANKWAMVV